MYINFSRIYIEYTFTEDFLLITELDFNTDFDLITEFWRFP